MSSVSVDILSVVLATISGFAINSFWYMPNVFGNIWQREIGKSKKPHDNTWKYHATLIVSNFITAYVLAHFLQFAFLSMGLEGNIVDSALVATWAWFGFVATTSFVSGKQANLSLEAWFIEAGQKLVSLIVMSAIIASL